jgi:sialic acid synthase SpsE
LAKEQLAAKSKTTKAETDKEILKISKNYYERFVELIDKAESSGYDFIKFQDGFHKVDEKKTKTKTPIKRRKKI